MNDDQRFRLHFAPYKTPRFKYGAVVHDAVRGEVKITGLTDAPIPWPVGVRVGGGSSRAGLIVYKGLARAVQQESNQAVAHWWGVTGQTVTAWRRALGVELATKGSSRLWAINAIEHSSLEMAQAKSRDPAQDSGRREKIAAAKRGRPRPPHVHEALRKAHVGKPLKKSTRRKLSAAHRS